MAKSKQTIVASAVQNDVEVMEVSAQGTLTEVIEAYADKEIASFDPYEARILELKEKYSGLGIKGVEDVEGYAKVREAVAELRTLRTSTDADRKQAKAPFIQAGKSIEEKAQWIISEIEKIEDPLHAEKDRIDKLRDKIKQDRIAFEAKRATERTAELTKLGVQFIDGQFVFEDIAYEQTTIHGSDEEIYAEIRERFREKWQVKENERLAEIGRQKAIADQIAAERAELDKQQQAVREAENRLKEAQRQAEREFQAKQDAERAELEAKERIKREEEAAKTKKLEQELAAIKKAEADKLVEELRKQEELAQATDKTKWNEIVEYLKKCPSYEMRSGQYRKKRQMLIEKVQEIIDL